MDRRKIRIAIGKNLRQNRKGRGVSDAILAARLGITPDRLKKYENGVLSPSCDELIQAASVLGCSVDDLCEYNP